MGRLLCAYIACSKQVATLRQKFRGYVWATRVKKPLSQVPTKCTCLWWVPQWVREQKPCFPVQSLGTLRKSTWADKTFVLFRHGTPSWQKSVTDSWTLGWPSKRCIWGTSHNREVAGCSSATGTPNLRQISKTRNEKRANALASLTRSWSLSHRLDSPHKASSDLRGHGSRPSFLQAAHQDVRGVPNHTPAILSQWINNKINDCSDFLQRSCNGSSSMSISQIDKRETCLTFKALLTPPDPEKSSRKTLLRGSLNNRRSGPWYLEAVFLHWLLQPALPCWDGWTLALCGHPARIGGVTTGFSTCPVSWEPLWISCWSICLCWHFHDALGMNTECHACGTHTRLQLCWTPLQLCSCWKERKGEMETSDFSHAEGLDRASEGKVGRSTHSRRDPLSLTADFALRGLSLQTTGPTTCCTGGLGPQFRLG